jgi:hypothetical protein
MKRQHLTRRIVLSAVMFSLAILATVGGGDSANAEPRQGSDHGSKEAFKKDCEDAEGSFADSPQDGLTLCAYPDGDLKSCDQQGNNCVIYPPKAREETNWANPAIDATVDATIIDDKHTLAPADAPLEAIAEAPVEAPVESQVVSAAESSTLAAPVEAPVTLTEEPVAAEEPVGDETSAEQP